MKFFIPLVLLFAVFSCSETQEPSDNPSDFTAFADSLFQHHVDSAEIAGAAVLVRQGDEILLDKSYGYASLELNVPVPEDAAFEIGSVTKQFTAAAILRLVEQGKLSLEDDMSQYLEFDSKGRTVTINQLLNHTSGIPSYTEIPEFWEMSLHSYPRDTLLRVVEKEEFFFEPGEALIYNNSAYFFLGLIIEKASEMSYEEYLEQEFFSPLGMNHSHYCSNSKVYNGKVYGYGYSPEGLNQKSYLDHTWPYAAGSLCSTTHDLDKWLTSLHNGQVFNQDQYSIMTTPLSLNDGTPVRYAMGLTNASDYGHQVISHGGGINGFLTDTRYYPESDLYVIVLVNTTGPFGAGYFAGELTWQILDKKEPESVEAEGDLSELTGDYTGPVRGRRSLTLDISIDGNSLIVDVQGENDPDTIVTYLGNNTWADGNERIYLKDNELRIDQVSGYYVLKRVNPE